jgi:hypothetical protein
MLYKFHHKALKSGPSLPFSKQKESGSMPDRLIHNQHLQETLADAGTGVSASAAIFSWLAQANDILTLLATLTAITAGFYAAKFHRAKLKLLEEQAKKARDTHEEDSHI